MPKKKDDSYYQYWCIPATIPKTEGTTHCWILFRDRISDVGNTGWTKRAATPQGPEPVAIRYSGQRFWKKWTGTTFIPEGVRKEELTQEEAVAIILMIKR